jgi:DNA-binding MarR family transcriptional regulator
MKKVPERQHTVNSRPRTEAGDAFSGLVVRVLRLGALLAQEGDALASGAAGQTTARWQVLAAVEDEPRSVSSVAHLLGLARQSVQRVANVLEASGLVTYEDNPHHRRARLVTLTDEGRATLGLIQQAQRPWADAIGASIGTEDLLHACALLDRVHEALVEPESP